MQVVHDFQHFVYISFQQLCEAREAADLWAPCADPCVQHLCRRGVMAAPQAAGLSRVIAAIRGQVKRALTHDRETKPMTENSRALAFFALLASLR